MTAPGFAPVDGGPLSRYLLSWDARDRRRRARSGQLLTFARPSNATARDSVGRMIRPGHSAEAWHMSEGLTPGVFDQPSLLIEPATTNKYERSTEFDNAYWSKGNVTVGANTAVAPDGTLTADKIQETTANGSHAVTRSQTVAAGAYWTQSVFVRAAERTRVFLAVINGSDNCNCRFYLDTMTTTPGTAGAGSVINAGIERWGNGWYRVFLSGRVNASSTSLATEIWLMNGTNTSYVGVTGEGLFLWGAQFEEGSTAGSMLTSFVPTNSGTATRSATTLSGQLHAPLPNDLSVFVRVVRPPWASNAVLGTGRGLLSLSAGLPRLHVFWTGNGTVGATLQDPGGNAFSVTTALPADQILEFAARFTNLYSGGQVRLDVGSGFGSPSATAPAITALGSTALSIGGLAYDPAGCYAAGIQAVRIGAGLLTRAQMAVDY